MWAQLRRPSEWILSRMCREGKTMPQWYPGMHVFLPCAPVKETGSWIWKPKKVNSWKETVLSPCRQTMLCTASLISKSLALTFLKGACWAINGLQQQSVVVPGKTSAILLIRHEMWQTVVLFSFSLFWQENEKERKSGWRFCLKDSSLSLLQSSSHFSSQPTTYASIYYAFNKRNCGK